MSGTKQHVPGQMSESFRAAHSALVHINSECGDVKEYLAGNVCSMAHRVAESCAMFDTIHKPKLLFSPPEFQQILSVLSCILGKILDELDTSVPWDDSSRLHCAHQVALAVKGVLALHSSSSGTPVTVRLALAKQLQQAELLQPCSHALSKLADMINTQALLPRNHASGIPLNSSIARGNHAFICQAAAGQLSLESTLKISYELLSLSLQVGMLWPGSVYKSAAARPLLPAAAKLAAALARLSAQLYRQNPDQQQANNVMEYAVHAAHWLALIHHQAVDDMPVIGSTTDDLCDAQQQQVWNLQLSPEFRSLLLLLLTLHAQAMRSSNCAAVQQLWVALGYPLQQLPAAVNALLHGLRTEHLQDILGVIYQHCSYSIEWLMLDLSRCWAMPLMCDLACEASYQQSVWPQLRQESHQILLMMTLAKQLFLQGPDGVRGDLQLIVAAATCYSKYILTATLIYHDLPDNKERPSAVFPTSDALRLLLQFLQYGGATVQQQQNATTEPCSSNNSSEVALQQTLLTVLSVVEHLSYFTGVNRDDIALQECWLLWGQHVAQLIDGALRRTASSVAADQWASSTLQDVVEPCMYKWMKMLTVCRTADSLSILEQINRQGHVILEAGGASPAAPEPPNAASVGGGSGGGGGGGGGGCGGEARGALQSRHPMTSAVLSGLSSHSSSSNAATDTSAGGLTEILNQSMHACANPTPLELQVLSSLTSLCKYMKQSIELVPGVHVRSARTELLAVNTTFAAALIIERWCVWQQQQSLLHPAVRPWLSLLGRCLVMMGQRLKMIKEEFLSTDLIQQHEQRLLSMLKSSSQTDQRQSEQEATGLHCRLLVAQTQGGSQQLATTLHQELQGCLRKFDRAEAELEAAWNEAQVPADQQQYQQQQLEKAMAEMQLCRVVNNTAALTQTIKDLSDSVTALIVLVRLLTVRWVKLLQQQQHQEVAMRDSSHVAAKDALMSTAMQRLQSQLLPGLISVEGMCSSLSAASAETAASMSEDKEKTDAGFLASQSVHCPAAAVMTRCFDRAVKNGVCISWLQDIIASEELDAQLQPVVSAEQEDATRMKDAAAGKQQSLQLYVGVLLPLMSSEPYQQLHDQLVAIGSELITALPHCWCCNNPGCDNLSADSELQLISGKQRICAGCTGGSTDKDINSTAARYCSVECQKQHWKQHRKVCKRLHKR